MGIMYNIRKDIKREKIINKYISKDRLIATEIYTKLKSLKKCMRCKKKFNGRIPEIHHKKPVCKNGSNDEDNLMAVCTKCHKILDAEEMKRDEV
jgi:5-methylcytosine-specific restriction endonuclease McrA